MVLDVAVAILAFILTDSKIIVNIQKNVLASSV
jgi:hypothetical protein